MIDGRITGARTASAASWATCRWPSMGGPASAARADVSRPTWPDRIWPPKPRGSWAARWTPPPSSISPMVSGGNADRAHAEAVIEEAHGSAGGGAHHHRERHQPRAPARRGQCGTGLRAPRGRLRARLARRAYPGALATTDLTFLDLDKDTSVRGGAALVLYEGNRARRAHEKLFIASHGSLTVGL